MGFRLHFGAFLVFILLFQAACSVASAAPAKPQTQRAKLNRALRAWAGFPVRSSPRPLVLLGGYVQGPAYGFPDTNSKIAFGNGEINAPATWPMSPTSSMGFPIIPASAAFEKLTTHTNTIGTPPPLSITGVQLGTGEFLTDRGYRTLPAWLFSLSGVQHPAEVLAVAPSAIYSSPASRGGAAPAGVSATVSPGSRHIVFSFLGTRAATGPCGASYTIALKESKQAIAVAVISHGYKGQYVKNGAIVLCTDVGYTRYAAAELAAPVGARVLVDADSEGAASVTYVHMRGAKSR